MVVQILKPTPLDWTESFSAESTIPYGGYLSFELLPSLFPENDISQNRAPIFEYADTTHPAKNWIFINKDFGLDEYETNILLSQVEQGAQVFIAARTFQSAFKDTFDIGTTFNNPFLGGGSILDDDTSRVNLTNPSLEKTDWFT